MLCRFCSRDFPKLAKAHIIPRSFFKVIRGTSKYSIVMQASKNEVKQDFKQAGIYDSTILCEECEALFTAFDDHGFRVFNGVFKKPQVYLDPFGNQCAFLLPNVRYDLLKLFVMSLAWRASVSTDPFFRRVNLGPHENRIRDMIAARDCGDQQKYAFFCVHPLGEEFPGSILPARCRKIAGLNCVQIHLPKMYVVLKVDNRPFLEPFATLMLRQNPPHFLAFLPYRGSLENKYVEAVRKVLRSHEEKVKKAP